MVLRETTAQGKQHRIRAGTRVSNAPPVDLPLRERWSVRAWDLRPQPVDRTALHIDPRCGPSCRTCGFFPALAGEDLRPPPAGLQSIEPWRQARLHPETTTHGPQGLPH